MASGRPDWYGSMTLHGKYTDVGVDTYKSINVDEEGNLLALMTGLIGGVYRPIAVDAGGVMRANLYAQGLNFLTVRPAYGSDIREGDDKLCNAGAMTDLFEIEGQGVIYSGMIFLTEVDDGTLIKPHIQVDRVDIQNLRFDNLYDLQVFGESKNIISLIRYDTVNGLFACVTTQLITFEEYFTMKIWNDSGANETVYWEFVYALTPERV